MAGPDSIAETNRLLSIQTPRLIVRRFAETDLEDFMAYQELPEVRRYLVGEPMGEAAAARYLAEQAALPLDERGKWHGFAVEHVADRRVIGDVGAFLQKRPDDEGDVGFQFHPEYHGQGYAAEAVRVLLGVLFSELGLARVTSGCDARNAASSRLMERLGMRRAEESERGVKYELTRGEFG